MDLRIKVVEAVTPSPAYGQLAFRLSESGGDTILSLALHIPERLAEDRKPVSTKQRDTLETFFLGHDVLPRGCGWQQASALLDIRSLSFAVTETLHDGFWAANRVALAPLIATYISQSPYLRAVARGWSLGTRQDGADHPTSAWLSLVGGGYYRELFEFSVVARADFMRAWADQEAAAN